jgi:hypothetical protein
MSSVKLVKEQSGLFSNGIVNKYVDENGLLHSENDKPAYEYINSMGTVRIWYEHGKRHRIKWPAYCNTKNGVHSTIWYYKGMCHRIDGPAMYTHDTYDNHKSISYYFYDIPLGLGNKHMDLMALICRDMNMAILNSKSDIGVVKELSQKVIKYGIIED